MKREYARWLAQKDLDTALRQELENMDDQAIEEAFYKPLSFGTGGMRGILGAGINRMNRYTLRKAARGFALFLLETYETSQKRGVVIAYDNRQNSETFAKECVSVLAALDIPSYLFESMRPTPVLSFAVRHLNACGGIMITASHNPANYNGFKVYDEEGCQLVPSLAERLIEHVASIEDLFMIDTLAYAEVQTKKMVKNLSRELDQAYLAAIKSVQLKPDNKKTVKVIFTPLHGASREIGLRALIENGYNVIPVEEQMVADSKFSTVKSPNPEDPKAFEKAIAYGKKHCADILLATDPDGDRLGVAVRNGSTYNFLTGNQLGAIFIAYLLETLQAQHRLPDKGIIYDTIVTSQLGAHIASTYGVKSESTLTGFKFIGEKMKQLESSQDTFIMGYEESYGYVLKDVVRDKDAIQGMLLVCEIANDLKKMDLTLTDYLNTLYELYGAYQEDLINLAFEGKAGEETMQAIMDYFRTNEIKTMANDDVLIKEDYLNNLRYENGHQHVLDYPTSNVLKFFIEDGWFVLRPSGTEPKLKIYLAMKKRSVEESQTALKELKESIMEVINNIPTIDEDVKA